MDFFTRLFDTSDFPPRWHCGSWTAGHGYLHILSDLGVWSAYVAIPCVLGYFVLRRKDIPFRAIFWLFGAFILACGTTHLMEALIFWWPAYRLAGLIKLFTALVSWATVAALVLVVPKMLAMRSPEDLEREIAARRLAESALEQANAELRQQVEALRASEERFRLLVDGTRDHALFMLDPSGRVASWNSGAERIKQYRAQEIVGEHFSRFYPQEAVAQGWPDEELRCASAAGRFEDEGWRLRKDGSRFWANVVITALRDDAGRLRGFSKITRDMTERKQAEDNARRLLEEAAARRAAEEYAAALWEERERLRVTLHSIGDGVIATDPEGRVTLLNPVAEALTGWQSHEARERPLHDIFPIVNEKTRQTVENPVTKVLREGTVVGLANHTVLISKSGGERPIADSAAPIKDDKGKLHGVVLVFRDATEERNQETRRAARIAVTQTLAEAGTLAEALPRILGALGEELGWQVGAFWLVDPQDRELRCLDVWQSPAFQGEKFAARCRQETFKPGVGLPGRVWATGQPAWIADVVEDDNFPRASVAAQVRLRAAFAFPVLGEGRVLGVVELFREDVHEPDADLLEMASTFGTLIGQHMERRSAEERLRDEREWLHTTLASIGDGVIATDTEGRVTFLNPIAEALTGWSEEEGTSGMPLTTVFNIVNEESRLPVENPVFKALREGQIVGLANHTLLIARDGTERPIADSAAPIRHRNGKVAGVVLVFRDVTEQRQADEALRRSETQFRQLADSLAQIVWMAGPDGSIDYLNRRWTELTGLPQTVSNDAWGQILHPDDAPAANQRWAASQKGGSPFDMEIRLLDRREQSYRWHLIRTVPVKDEAGRVIRWFGTSTDIHEQKRAEEAARYLAQASAELAVVVNYESTLQKIVNLAVPHFADWSAVDLASDDGSLRRLAVAHQDPDKITLVHELMRDYPPDPESPRGAFAVLRTGRPELIGEIPDELLVQGAKDEHHLGLIRSLGLKSFICVPLVVSSRTLGVLTFATAESGRRYTETDLALALDLAKRAAVAIENTQLYQALRDADRSKNEFLATLAHELRNPLAPIRTGLQVLRLANEPAAREQAREMMERQLGQMVRLVDDLLDISRITRNKLELRKARIPLASIIENAVETARPLIDSKGHALTVTLPAQAVYLDADLTRLAQVFWNLLNNAAKYTDPGGRIDLSAECQAEEVVVTVRDNGIGVSAEALPSLFRIFAQVDHSLERSQGGLGIGLALVKGLVEMHGGSVTAHSAGVGRGSKFVVRLPLAQAGCQETDPPANEVGRDFSGRRLLVVDDNRDAAASLATMLSLVGHDTRIANDGLEALDVAAAFRPEVVLLDIGMPKLNGYDVARRIRQEPWGANMVLIACTGWGHEEDRRRSRDAGFNHHLVKPVDPQALMKLLAGLETANR